MDNKCKLLWHSECRSILLMFTEIFRNKIFEYKGRGYIPLKSFSQYFAALCVVLGIVSVFISEISLSEIFVNRLRQPFCFASNSRSYIHRLVRSI